MLRNYFTVALRNLWKNKGYTFLNIAGLGVGMACAFLIMLWVHDELTYNAFHENYDQLYQVKHNWNFDGTISTGSAVPFSLASGLKNEFAEIKHACRVNWPQSSLLRVGDKKINISSRFVDSAFLKMFTFRMLHGSPKNALNDPHSIVLTEEKAKVLFGNQDPLGKIIRFDDKSSQVDVKVTGVLANILDNSSLKFDCILPYSLNLSMNPWLKGEENNWGNSMTETYVQLLPNTTASQISPKLFRFLAMKDKELKKESLFLQPLAKLHLYDKFENGQEAGGQIDYVRMFSGIAGLILLIACINFMNLATARSEKRAKEVGIRKVVGSSRRSLIFQFLGESNLLALQAFVLAVALVVLLLPWFNQLSDKKLNLSSGNVVYWLVGLGIAIVAGMLAGLYPAFYLSSFQPIRVLKSTLQAGRNASLTRKLLVNLQFTFSIMLIISVIVINQQLQHSRNRPVGYERNNLLMLDMNKELRQHYEVFRQHLLNSGMVTAVAYTSAPITQIWSSTDGMGWTDKNPDEKVVVAAYGADYDYVQTFGVKVRRGRGFSREMATDSSAVLINEAAVKEMGLTDPLSKQIKSAGKDWNIIGVMDNVIIDSPYEKAGPVVVFNQIKGKNIINIRLRNGVNMQTALAATEQIFSRSSPSYPFDYRFVNDEYNAKFTSEVRVGHLANAFAGLAIFISCLGLFGLAAYTAERRTKEIGIRKILGASLSSIVSLLSREYVGLVAVSLLIAAPVAWYFLEQWLQNYPYRININWWVFILAGAMSLLIALFTVSFQSIKAALANPVKSLRTE